jgi:hypothetical protein
MKAFTQFLTFKMPYKQEQIPNLRNPAMREQGALNGKGFKKRYATNSSTASSTKEVENRCEATHRFASLQKN